MGTSNVVLTAGNAIKKEKKLTAGTAKIGSFVMPSAEGVMTATAGYSAQIAIVDYTSANGMNKLENGYAAGDQIPLLYPTAGCEVNVLCSNVAGEIAKGALLAIDVGGTITAGESNAIGVALEAVTVIAGTPATIKMEVLK